MVKKATTSLMAKAGSKLKAAHEAHKNDDTNFGGGGSLPPGIENGVAQLVECRFGTYEKGDNKGELFFYAAGVIKAPHQVDGIPITGLRTSIIEPLHDTPTRSRATFDEHYAWILNELRKLGLDTKDIEPDDIEDAVAGLVEAGPHFRFRTWQGTKKQPGEAGYNEKYDGPNAPDPRVNEVWGGFIKDYVDEESGDDGVEDATEEVEEPVKPAAKAAKPSAPATKPAATTKTPPKPAAAATTAKAKTPPKAKEVDYDTQSLDITAIEADNGVELAIIHLTTLCETAGIDPEDEAYPNWVAVVEALQSVEAAPEVDEEGNADIAGLGAKADDGDGDAAAILQDLCDKGGIDSTAYASWQEVEDLLAAGGDPALAEEAAQPDVKDMFYYLPPKAKKPVMCEVTMVNKTKELVNLKDSDKGVFYKNVPWSELLNEG